MQRLLEQLRTTTALSATEAARRAGVNRSTLHRIATGAMDPTVGTLREIAIAYGFDLDIGVRPLSDPDAATAARVLLDHTLASFSPTPGVDAWISRLQRAVGDDPLRITEAAGAASSVLHRPGAIFLRGTGDPFRLASAGDASGVDWAVSGAPALALLSDDATDEAATEEPSILWSRDPRNAARLLGDTHREVAARLNAQVIVVDPGESVLLGAAIVDRVRYVAPLQAVLDGFGLGARAASSARRIAEEWS